MMSWNMTSQQNIRPTHSGIFIPSYKNYFWWLWLFQQESNTVTKTTKYPRQQSYDNAPNLSHLAITRHVLVGVLSQVQLFQSKVDFFFLTGTTRNKHQLLLSCIVSWLWCTNTFPWQKLNNLFFSCPTALLISAAAPNRSLLFIRLIAL